MPQDFQGRIGPSKATRPDAGHANTREVPVFAIVKDNIDPIRSGRLRVYVSYFGGPNPDDESCWVTVNYMSPFYGRTVPENDGKNPEFKRTPHSYGIWNSPPDIGTTVICIFINGDTNFGYWIGCVPDPEALHMVPAIGSSTYVIGNQKEAESYGGATQLPVTNSPINAESEEIYYLDSAKPIHSYQAAILNKQGLIRDTIRGTITTNSQRESPSRVGWGVSTPGRPIYEGGYTDSTILDNLKQSSEKLRVIGRRGGHSIIMDDGAITGEDQHIRIRTAEGHQILLSDSGDTIHIIHKNGQSWIEMGKEGTIDMYSTNSVNIRTQGDLNLHADNNININAKKNLNISAENISMEAIKDFGIKSGNNFKGYTVGNFTWKVDGPMSMLATGEASYSSVAKMFINGSRINLNSGQAGLTPAIVNPITQIAHTDTLYDNNKGFLAAPGSLLSIVSRLPAHAPWANANQGVDVEVKLGANEALPTAAPEPVQQVNQQAQASLPAQTVTTSQMATVPNTGNTESNVLTATAAKVAATNDQTKNSVTQGTSVTDNKLAVGAFSSSPKELATGAIKPGTDVLTERLISEGKNPQKVLTPNMFTGKFGNNLNEFTNTVTNQVKNVTQSFENSKKLLSQSNLLNGNNTITATAGIIFAGAKEGVSKVVDLVKNVGTNIAGSIQGASSNIASSSSQLMKNISAANFAAGMQEKLSSGLNGAASGLAALTKVPNFGDLIEKTKGLAVSMFSAISNSMKPFKAGVPQNIKEIAKQNAQQLKASTDIVASASLPNVANIASNLTNSVGTIANDLATGLSALPGGEKGISNVVNKNDATSVTNLSVIKDIGNSIKNNATAVMNKISQGITSVANMTGLSMPSLPNKNIAKDTLSKLNTSASSELSASLDAISGNGPVPIKAPTVKTDTLSTTKAIISQTTELVGEGVPVPGGKATQEQKDRFQTELNDLQEVQATLDKFARESKKARITYENAKKIYPVGDPKLIELQEAWLLVDRNPEYIRALEKAKKIT